MSWDHEIVSMAREIEDNVLPLALARTGAPDLSWPHPEPIERLRRTRCLLAIPRAQVRYPNEDRGIPAKSSPLHADKGFKSVV